MLPTRILLCVERETIQEEDTVYEDEFVKIGTITAMSFEFV